MQANDYKRSSRTVAAQVEDALDQLATSPNLPRRRRRSTPPRQDWTNATLWANQWWQYQVKAADIGLRAKDELEQPAGQAREVGYARREGAGRGAPAGPLLAATRTERSDARYAVAVRRSDPSACGRRGGSGPASVADAGSGTHGRRALPAEDLHRLPRRRREDADPPGVPEARRTERAVSAAADEGHQERRPRTTATRRR